MSKARGVRFRYQGGELRIREDEDGENGVFLMDMAASAPESIENERETIAKIRRVFGDETSLTEASVNADDVGVTYSAKKNSIGDTFMFVDVSTFKRPELWDKYFYKSAVDSTEFADIEGRGVCVVFTARGGTIPDDARASCDYVCRWFGPRVGIPEDPVTGSASAGIAPHLHAIQASSSSPSSTEYPWFQGVQRSRERGAIDCRLSPSDPSRLVQIRGAAHAVRSGVVTR
jgi:predicted PhzF superfamily epimerase YddE/YHI9